MNLQQLEFAGMVAGCVVVFLLTFLALEIRALWREMNAMQERVQVLERRSRWQ